MKILITGSTGLLGQALLRRLARPGNDVVGVSRHPVGSAQGHAAPAASGASPAGQAHQVCDLTDADAVWRLMQSVRPHVVLHAQAMSDVDRCEREPEEAERLNVWALEHLCEALRGSGALLLAVSTDYVFDGDTDQPYDEEDAPRPLSVYGRTKLAGEAVALGYPAGYVVRVSTLYGPGRMNFCDAIVERARRDESIEAFTDQATSPTYTNDVAEGVDALVEALQARRSERLPRVYHLTNACGCRRVEFAQRVLQQLGRPTSLLRPVSISQAGRPARRPRYSVLTSRHLPALIGRTLRPWDSALDAYLRQRRWIN